MEDFSKDSTFGYQEAHEASDRYAKALNPWYRRMVGSRVGTALARAEDGGWEVVALTENAKQEKRARKIAKKCLNGVPTSIRSIGPAESI